MLKWKVTTYAEKQRQSSGALISLNLTLVKQSWEKDFFAQEYKWEFSVHKKRVNPQIAVSVLCAVTEKCAKW